MPAFKAGVAGPIPLADGRVITADQGPFNLDLREIVEGAEAEFDHDRDLIERGVIVATEAVEAEVEEVVAKVSGEPPKVQPPAAPAQSTAPAGGATTAESGQKAGE